MYFDSQWRPGFYCIILLCFVVLVHSTFVNQDSDTMNANNLTIKTTEGFVQGFTTADTRNWYGIPFAAPPIGDNRWRASKKPKSWDGIRNATTFSASCIQWLGQEHNITFINEDCLYLNIWAPLQPFKLPLPVMVFIHGGSFTSGSGSWYQGTSIAKQEGVVVVSLNYRLGPFGFLGLGSDDGQNPSFGNYGIQDQIAGLQWVQSNIAAFGGDPSKITVFGESAGAISICIHLVASQSAGLFRRALMESGFCSIWTKEQAQQQARSLADKLHCSNGDIAEQLNCLRSKTAEQVSFALKDAKWFPTIDGSLVAEQPYLSIQKGRVNKVALMLGTNLNEWSLFSCKSFAQITVQQYKDIVFHALGEKAASCLLPLYPPEKYTAPIHAMIDLFSDGYFKCQTREAALGYARLGLETYVYSFDHAPGWSNACLQVAHSFELPFLFRNLIPQGYQFTPQEQILSNKMIRYWGLFAKGEAPWQTFTINGDSNIVLNLTVSSQIGYRKRQCDIWSQCFFP